jgi:hypothetical protein
MRRTTFLNVSHNLSEYVVQPVWMRNTTFLKRKCKRGTPAKKVGFRGLYQTSESDFDDFRLDFLGKFQAVFETALAHESGP